MSLVVVSARVHSDNVEAVASETRRTLAAIAAAGPDVGYAVYRAPDGVTFVTLLDTRESGGDPLLAVPAYVEYQQALGAWAAEPPSHETWEEIGVYDPPSRHLTPHQTQPIQ